MTVPELISDHLLGKVCIGVGVGVFIMGTGLYPELGDYNDGVVRYLMCLRGELRTEPDGPGVRNEPNLWDAPGGGVDFGESLRAAVEREIGEELGVSLRGIEYLGHFEHILWGENGRPVEHWISHTHLARIVRSSSAPAVPLVERSKIVQLRYMTLAEIEQASITISTKKALPQLAAINV